MKKYQRNIASALSGILLSTTIMIPLTNAQVSEDSLLIYKQNEEDLDITYQMPSEEFLIELIESEKENYIDPSYGDEIIQKIESESNNKIQTRGKATWTAKAGAVALKKAMSKIGQKSWDKQVSKIEKTLGVTIVALHWKGVNNLINVLSNSDTTVTNATSNFLVKRGFNRTLADIIARTFVSVFL